MRGERAVDMLCALAESYYGRARRAALGHEIQQATRSVCPKPILRARLPSSERGALGTSACFSEGGFRYAMRLRYGLVARRCASVSYRIRECKALSGVSRVFTLLHSPVRSRSE